jgi:hypothetical protein
VKIVRQLDALEALARHCDDLVLEGLVLRHGVLAYRMLCAPFFDAFNRLEAHIRYRIADVSPSSMRVATVMGRRLSRAEIRILRGVCEEVHS